MAAIKDVARLAGFSVSAVSKYLKDPTSVRPTTRERIEKAIYELDYVPSTQARALRSGKTGMISIISPNITNPFFAEVFSAIQAQAKQYGYTALLQTISSVQEVEESVVSHTFAVSSTSRIDGMIVCFPDDDALMNVLRKQWKQLPIVLLSWSPRSEADANIVVSLGQSIYEITSYLIQQGHRRIGYVGAPESSTTSRQKESGFRRAMEENGLEIVPNLFYHGSYCPETGYLATQKFWQQAQPPSAIITEADIFAVGCIKYCHNKGIKVPEQLAITGFDDIPMAALYHPPITTVRMPIHKIGTSAVDLLYQFLQDEPFPGKPELRFTTELVVRRSTNSGFIEVI